MNIIVAEDLKKTYKTYKKAGQLRREVAHVRAVDGISFTVEEGAICGLLGPNGAGKSTTVKMLAGALYPSAGRLDVMGYSPARDRKKYVRHIGAVFGQKSQLIWDIPPIDSFKMNRAIYGIPNADYNRVLDELVTLLDLSEVLEKPTRVLSLGERMKCEFIMAMLHQPKIVFLDEPTIGLDVVAKVKIREFIKKVNNKGTTIILTTHDLEDVKQLAGHVIIINRGVKVLDDTLQHLQQYLGGKKIVDLTLSEPYTDGLADNVRLVEQKSPLELTLEVDTSQRAISDFIEDLSDQINFSDISVRELPMEEIIMQIYNETSDNI